MAEGGSGDRVLGFLNESFTNFSRPRINMALRLVGRWHDGRSRPDSEYFVKLVEAEELFSNSSHNLSVSFYLAKYR